MFEATFQSGTAGEGYSPLEKGPLEKGTADRVSFLIKPQHWWCSRRLTTDSQVSFSISLLHVLLGTNVRHCQDAGRLRHGCCKHCVRLFRMLQHPSCCCGRPPLESRWSCTLQRKANPSSCKLLSALLVITQSYGRLRRRTSRSCTEKGCTLATRLITKEDSTGKVSSGASLAEKG